MPSLHEIQQTFLRAIYSRDEEPALLDSLTDRQPGRQRRLAAYRGTIFHNRREALRAVYPVVCKLVGTEFFDFAADLHVADTPSRSGNIHDYGSSFGDFLDGFGPASGIPYLPDTARLEWCVHEVFHAEDTTELDLGRLADVAPEHYGNLKFSLSPACRLLASSYPVHIIWQANQQEETPEIQLDTCGALLLARRRHSTIELLPLGSGEYVLLKYLAAGKRFAEALHAALDAQPGLDPTPLLLRHVRAGTLTDFSLHPLI